MPALIAFMRSGEDAARSRLHSAMRSSSAGSTSTTAAQASFGHVGYALNRPLHLRLVIHVADAKISSRLEAGLDSFGFPTVGVSVDEARHVLHGDAPGGGALHVDPSAFGVQVGG